jgi:hypothetical protein
VEHNVGEFSNEDLIDNIIVWLCDQELKKPQIKALLAQYRPSIADDESEALIDQAFENLATIHNEQYSPQEVINDHVAKYEQIFDFFNSIGHASGSNKAMQAKERLLGLLKENNMLSLTKRETVINIDQPEYDTNQLTPVEQDRFKELLSKCTLDEKGSE